MRVLKDYQTITLPENTWSILQVLLEERCQEVLPQGWKRLVQNAIKAMEEAPLHKRSKVSR